MERKKVIKEFYRVYRQLQKRNNLRLYSRFSIYNDNIIEIWQYKGEKRVRNICKVKEDDEIKCYKRAIEALKNYEMR